MTARLLLFCLCLTGCAVGVKAPAPINVTPKPSLSEQTAADLAKQAHSKAAAAAIAAQHANESNPDGLAKTATAEEVKVVIANLDAPKPEDVTEAFERVNAALRGDLKAAQGMWNAALTEAEKLKGELAQARAEAQREREAAAKILNSREAEWQATFDRLNDEARKKAEADQRWFLNLIFHGGGALLLLAGIGCFTIFSSLPFAGTKVALGLLAAGAFSIGCGIAANWVLDHPWIALMGVGIPLLGSFALAYANHWHGAQAINTTPTQ